jgi:hypothetical protein
MISATGFPAPWGMPNTPNSGIPVTYAMQMDSAGDHAHWLNGNTAAESGNHSHTVDIPPFNINVDIAPFNSGALGSGAGHNILQSFVVTLKMIKVL